MNGRPRPRRIGRRITAPNRHGLAGCRGAERWQWDLTDPVIPGHPAAPIGGGLQS